MVAVGHGVCLATYQRCFKIIELAAFLLKLTPKRKCQEGKARCMYLLKIFDM